MPTNEDKSSSPYHGPSFQEEFAAMKEEGYVCSQMYRVLLERHGMFFMSPDNGKVTQASKKLGDDAS